MSDEKQNLIVKVDEILPERVPVVPIRHRPVFPGMITPLVLPGGKIGESFEHSIEKSEYIGLLLQKDDSRRGVDTDNLYRVGSLAKVVKKAKLPQGGFHLLINSLARFKVEKFSRSEGLPWAEVTYHYDEFDNKDNETRALTRAVLSNAKEIMNQNPLFTEEMKVTLVNVDEPGKIADFVCTVLNLEKEEYQEVLETFDVKIRLDKTLEFLSREIDLLELQQKIEGRIQEKMTSQQREYMLREQLQQIRKELGIDGSAKEKNADYYREKIAAAKLPEEANEKAMGEVEKLEYIEPQSNEYGVIRNYLDTILDLPWQDPEPLKIDIKSARRILDRDHYGLNKIKDRIIEHLAVLLQKQEEKGSIICFVGPPGVGKTSLGKSIARAMGKKFFRFSLGGMRDEAEIKGHRRTYIGAMPGKIIQALKVVEEKDPVLMLDEIDKLGSSYQGDPSSALLEVLDPQQNDEFRDHYLDLPFDLSRITFITTANTLETIPGPLRDRMEIIALSGYITDEKVSIAQKYLVPRAIEAVGLDKKTEKLSAKVVKAIIEGYSREAGVRSLERQIQTVYRKKVAAKAEKKKFPSPVTEKDLEKLLGPRRFRHDQEGKIRHQGTALGMAYTQAGGALLMIESAASPGKGQLKLTGQLGEVMLESAQIALTYVKQLTDDTEYWQNHNVHIHVPDGATPKDGPSAGITMTTALLSLYKGKKIKQGFAMTGEIRLTGDVLPIGGLREKIMAAKRAGVKKIIFPFANEGDFKELPDILKKGVTPHAVAHYDEVAKLLF